MQTESPFIMMHLTLEKHLETLACMLGSLTDEQYTQRIRHLGQASIGGHSRHIIEILNCVLTGYTQGQVNYIHRHRNLELETNRELAIRTIREQLTQLNKTDKQLALYFEYENGEQLVYPFTTYFREIIYTIEHTVHHLALIKVALTEMNLELVNENFGVAYSTLVYRKTAIGS